MFLIDMDIDTDIDVDIDRYTVDSKKIEYGFRVIYGGVPSFLRFRIRGWSYSNFLASIAIVKESA